MLLLGIESSCDDTSAAIVVDGSRVLANVATNQDSFHARFGGIVPEIASRQHLVLMTAAVDDALHRAKLTFEDLDGIAVTIGPGLIGSLVIGVATAKALAYARRLPLYGINHLHGHMYAPFLDSTVEPRYPMLSLIVSGGHTQLVHVDGPQAIWILGRTVDDAAGEAFDKTARLLGLPFPGGPHLDRLASDGNPAAVAFPRHKAVGTSLNLSFSGLKTAARRFLESPQATEFESRDIAASFQAAIVDVLIDRLERAVEAHQYRLVTLTGGVAANSALQTALQAWGKRRGLDIAIPHKPYCTDNAAMIAAAAWFQGEATRCDPLTLVADPRLTFESGVASKATTLTSQEHLD